MTIGTQIANTTGFFAGPSVYANTTAVDVGNTIITSADIALGGTVTANGGLGSAGQVLTSAGSGNTYWSTVAANPTGSNTFVQFNDSGSFGASANLTFDKVTSKLTVNSLQLKSYTDTASSPTISGGTLTLDLNIASVFEVSLNANITTLTINNAASAGLVSSFVLELIADGTARSVTWPASFRWPSGIAPNLTSTNNKMDVITAYTTDGGTTYIAFVTGQNI